MLNFFYYTDIDENKYYGCKEVYSDQEAKKWGVSPLVASEVHKVETHAKLIGNVQHAHCDCKCVHTKVAIFALH